MTLAEHPPLEPQPQQEPFGVSPDGVIEPAAAQQDEAGMARVDSPEVESAPVTPGTEVAPETSELAAPTEVTAPAVAKKKNWFAGLSTKKKVGAGIALGVTGALAAVGSVVAMGGNDAPPVVRPDGSLYVPDKTPDTVPAQPEAPTGPHNPSAETQQEANRTQEATEHEMSPTPEIITGDLTPAKIEAIYRNFARAYMSDDMDAFKYALDLSTINAADIDTLRADRDAMHATWKDFPKGATTFRMIPILKESDIDASRMVANLHLGVSDAARFPSVTEFTDHYTQISVTDPATGEQATTWVIATHTPGDSLM